MYMVRLLDGADMSKFTFANLIAPIMLLAVGIVYQVRKDVEGITNRCIKMALAVLFLICEICPLFPLSMALVRRLHLGHSRSLFTVTLSQHR